VGRDAIFVAPGVFDPVLTKVGAWLASVVPAMVRPGERWLELGTGSGIVAVALAKAGARVVATDLDEAACANARMNAVLHGLSIDVRRGDLFAPVRGERFDGVVANLPFWPGTGPNEALGHAFGAGEDFVLLRRFTADLPAHAPRGWLAVSEAFAAFPVARAALGSAARLERRERVRGEWLDLFRFDAPREAGPTDEPET
jgi:release factor glutamine methyltransferase